MLLCLKWTLEFETNLVQKRVNLNLTGPVIQTQSYRTVKS